ncbi:MAG: tRNA (adenosine(37)-N6)-threonylcarbamoyltransferase complex dimerization subunit type 1 TsaB [Planctomycetales bacterium]|nr:tRNA (adenosine(37)-N6)-threonylcarbamoyltransferase complex dimerization subunit type 1 TsaB [Planctomycetales bacterium]
MRVLAIECSVTPGSIAVLDGEQCLERRSLPSERRTTQALTPMLDALLKDVGWQPTDIQLVATTIGPGSFTGLRVGVTTAKTFAYATNAAVAGIHTLQVVAEQAADWWRESHGESPARIHAVMDAQRQQLFAMRCEIRELAHIIEPSVDVVDQAAWLVKLSGEIEDEIPALLAGPIPASLIPRLPAACQIPAERVRVPDAATVGRLAARGLGLPQANDLWSLTPIYYRRSAAEEKLVPET